MSNRTRFEKGAKGNSEMAYSATEMEGVLIYYILLGRILQLPRGKGHKRTSWSDRKSVV